MQKDILEVVSHLNAAMANVRLYSEDHPQVVRYLERAHQTLLSLLDHRAELTLLTVDDDLVVDHKSLNATTPHLHQFIRLLKHCAVERITFTREVTQDELAQLIKDLVATDQDVVRSSKGIKLGKVRVMDQSDLDSK